MGDTEETGVHGPKIFEFKGTITEGEYKDGDYHIVFGPYGVTTVEVNGKELRCCRISWAAEAGEPAVIEVEGFVTDCNGHIFIA